MKRNYEQMQEDYKKRFWNTSSANTRGQLYLDDYYAVRDLATKTCGGKLNQFTLIETAMQIGVMIGIRCGELDAADKRKGKK